MNAIKVIPFKNPERMFKPTFIAVQGMTAEGTEATIGVIYHNKHGRHNLMHPGGHGFLAGSRNLSLVKRYAKTMKPDTQDGVFLDSTYGGYYVTYVEGPKKGQREFVAK